MRDERNYRCLLTLQIVKIIKRLTLWTFQVRQKNHYQRISIHLILIKRQLYHSCGSSVAAKFRHYFRGEWNIWGMNLSLCWFLNYNEFRFLSAIIFEKTHINIYLELMLLNQGYKKIEFLLGYNIYQTIPVSRFELLRIFTVTSISWCNFRFHWVASGFVIVLAFLTRLKSIKFNS